jgi:hypothetical protein
MLPPGGWPSNLRLFKPLPLRSDLTGRTEAANRARRRGCMQTGGLLGGSTPTGTGLQDTGPQSRVGVAELLEPVLELGASALHLTAGARPTVRVNGRLGQLEDFPVLQPAETQAMIYSILTQSGKSITLASMVDLANREREDHIMTVETRSSSSTATSAAWSTSARSARTPRGAARSRNDLDRPDRAPDR